MLGMSLVASFLILFPLGCKEDGTGPIEPPPGKRDYVWSIDSVDYGNLPSTIQLESIWGSSATDLWGAAGDAPDVRDCLWHYNGAKWTRATEGTPITEFTGNKTVYAVWGSAKNDVWTFGRRINGSTLHAFMMHFDGTRWTDATPSNVSSLSSILYDVYGVSNNDIWVGGYEYALHYDGQGWRAQKVADSLTIIGIAALNKAVFFHLSSPWGKQDVFIYRFQAADSSWKIVDQTTLTQDKFGGRPWIVGNVLYTLTDGVITTNVSDSGQIDTAGWRRVFTTNTYLTQQYAESVRDVFTVGQYNLVYHYNGENWKQLFISVPNHIVDPHALFWGVWTDGSEVFICDWQNGIMYHGR